MNLTKNTDQKSSNIKWSTNLPRYCTRCGNKMVEIPMKVQDYDSRTGEHANRRDYYWRCVKIKWWYDFSFSIHDEFHVIEKPDYMIGQYSYRGVLTIIRMGP